MLTSEVPKSMFASGVEENALEPTVRVEGGSVKFVNAVPSNA